MAVFPTTFPEMFPQRLFLITPAPCRYSTRVAPAGQRRFPSGGLSASVNVCGGSSMNSSTCTGPRVASPLSRPLNVSRGRVFGHFRALELRRFRRNPNISARLVHLSGEIDRPFRVRIVFHPMHDRMSSASPRSFFLALSKEPHRCGRFLLQSSASLAMQTHPLPMAMRATSSPDNEFCRILQINLASHFPSHRGPIRPPGIRNEVGIRSAKAPGWIGVSRNSHIVNREQPLVLGLETQI